MTVPLVVPALMNVPLKLSLRAIFTKSIRTLAPTVALVLMFVLLRLFIPNNFRKRIRQKINFSYKKAWLLNRAFFITFKVLLNRNHLTNKTLNYGKSEINY